MKLAPTSLGAEPKKLVLLGAILVVGGLVYWFQNRPDSSVSANVDPAPAAAAPVQLPPNQPSPTQPAQKAALQQTESAASGELPSATMERRGPLGGSSSDTWVPSLKKPDNLDVSKIDPRIDLDLLAKVRDVPLEGGSSSLFDYSKPPEPPAPPVSKIIPAPVPVPPPVTKTTTLAGPPQPPPPAPPVPFKYYGYAGKPTTGPLQGLFIEGDPITGTIYAKSEGDVIQNRYKIVRIGTRSADVEDTQTHHQQTLRMPEDQQ